MDVDAFFVSARDARARTRSVETRRDAFESIKK
jgi:hypothetical protein